MLSAFRRKWSFWSYSVPMMFFLIIHPFTLPPFLTLPLNLPPQESCARVLLFRGADKTIQNYANQDAWQVAVIAGNVDLADVIKGFKPDDVGKLGHTYLGVSSIVISETLYYRDESLSTKPVRLIWEPLIQRPYITETMHSFTLPM